MHCTRYLFFFVVFLVAIINAQSPTILGGPSNIPADQLQNLAQTDSTYSMGLKKIEEEFFKRYKQKLGKLLSASFQIVKGTKYNLIYESNLGNVQAIVYVVSWEKYLQLQKLQLKPRPQEMAKTSLFLKPITSISKADTIMQQGVIDLPPLRPGLSIRFDLSNIQASKLPESIDITPLRPVLSLGLDSPGPQTQKKTNSIDIVPLRLPLDSPDATILAQPETIDIAPLKAGLSIRLGTPDLGSIQQTSNNIPTLANQVVNEPVSSEIKIIPQKKQAVKQTPCVHLPVTYQIRSKKLKINQ